jgi:hypothetical protein
MHWVNMTAFITHCWKRIGSELWRWSGLVLAVWMASVTIVQAQTSVAELTEMRVEHSDGALLLNTQLRLELGPVVEDALVKGLAVHFVVEAEVMRDRWYWTDLKLGTASRHYRLAFQPLTRRWRLNVSSEMIQGAGSGGSISQHFETLNEALGVIRKQTNWQIAEIGRKGLQEDHYLKYVFKLDVSQLPRPFQIAAGNQTDWNLQVSKTVRLKPKQGD